jgi:hypothetical protein
VRVAHCTSHCGALAAVVVVSRQILPFPIKIPKRLGLGFNKTNQQLLLFNLAKKTDDLTIRLRLYSGPVS